MQKCLFTACLGTETNTFSPIPTGPELFRRTMLTRGGAHGDKPGIFALPLIAWRERALSLGWRVVEGVAAFATPAGNTTRAAFESLRDEILGELRGALPVDVVLLNLHGAMIADGYPDAEGDLIRRVREIVGPDIFVGVELDLHCHLTQQKLAAASAIVIYKEYPHVDVIDRAQELFTLAARTLAGEVHPVMAMHDCRMLGIFPTTREPLRGFVDRMSALEGRAGILSVSLGHGFPWGDTPEVGMRMLVVADGDAAKATALAERLGREIWSLREKITPPFRTIDQAVARVAEHGAGKPLVLADTADNPGIGAGGDSTFVVRRFIERQVGGIAVSPVWDPIATDIAFEAGLGAVLDIRIGGKLGALSGTPLDLRVVVKALVRDARQFLGSASSALGRMAWLRAGAADDDRALDIVVNDYRTQSFSPHCFTAVGIDPATKRALIVKSTQHFYNGFLPVADEIIYVSAPGTGSMDMRGLDYKNVSRPLWPRVDDPHA